MDPDYPLDPEADIYLRTDTWSGACMRPHRSLVLIVESQTRDRVITTLIPTVDDGYQLNWTAIRGWISVIQSERMSRTGISDEQRDILLDIALAYFGFANEHPDLQMQDLWLISGALLEAALELGPSERADDCLCEIAQQARRELPLSVFEGVDIPVIDGGLSADNMQDVFEQERTRVHADRHAFAISAERVAVCAHNTAQQRYYAPPQTAATERVMAASRRTSVCMHVGNGRGAVTSVDVTDLIHNAPDDDDYDDLPELVDM
ncbi:hypothetical protein C8T65DRAFT_693844 [Cerioporus squamosus]|nr:hypothetical protein C8T65DRAFT_693844 [Cerioporus squamosus]